MRWTFPFKVFTKSIWYAILGIDAAFLLSLGLVSYLLNVLIVPESGLSVFSAFASLVVIVASFAALYATGKYYFYKLFRKKHDISLRFIWKHFLVFLVVIVPVSIAVNLLHAYVPVLVQTNFIEITQTIISYGLIYLLYIIFISYQVHDTVPFFTGVKKIFPVNSFWLMVYTNSTYIISGYIIYNVLAFVFRIIYQLTKWNVILLKDIFDGLSMGMIFVCIVAIMSSNKILVHDIILFKENKKNKKHKK